MKKLLFLISLFFSITAHAKLNVVTTLPDFTALTKEVAGDLVSVKSLAKGDQDPHYLEAKPSFAVALNNADLVIYAGLDLEVGWLPILLTQARNPVLQPGAKGNLQASKGVRILEIPHGHVDRSHGDVHPEGNPHYWLNPRNGLIIARNIADKLSELDPANAQTYKKNLASFTGKLNGKITAWEKELASIRGTKIISHHKSFSYFIEWAGLNVIDYIEPKPGIPPSPGHILSLMKTVEEQKVPLLIAENYYDPKPSREIAKRTGARFLILPASVGGEPAIQTYDELFNTLIQRIKGAL